MENNINIKKIQLKMNISGKYNILIVFHYDKNNYTNMKFKNLQNNFCSSVVNRLLIQNIFYRYLDISTSTDGTTGNYT